MPFCPHHASRKACEAMPPSYVGGEASETSSRKQMASPGAAPHRAQVIAEDHHNKGLASGRPLSRPCQIPPQRSNTSANVVAPPSSRPAPDYEAPVGPRPPCHVVGGEASETSSRKQSASLGAAPHLAQVIAEDRFKGLPSGRPLSCPCQSPSQRSNTSANVFAPPSRAAVRLGGPWGLASSSSMPGKVTSQPLRARVFSRGPSTGAIP